jgi:hypothetical protein
MAKDVKTTSDTKQTVEIANREFPDKNNEDGTAAVETKVNFRYPLDLANFPATIKFTSYRVEGVNVGKQILGVIGNVTEAVGGGIGALGNAISPNSDKENPTAEAETETQTEEQKEILGAQEALGAVQSNIGGGLNVVGSFIEGLGRAAPSVQSYENIEGGTKVGSVMLPLTRDLRYNDVANYETVSLGLIGGLAETALRGQNPFSGVTAAGALSTAGPASGIVASIIANVAGAAVGAAIGGIAGGAGGALIGSVAAGNLGESLEGAVRSASRVTINPNQRALFRNVDIRNFTFAFKMIAANADEAQEIKRILKFFRSELYPEAITIGTGIPLAYKFPNVFQIEVKHKDDKQLGFKFQRCYLRDVQTLFNQTGSGIYKDGEFVEVDVFLSFIEYTALDKSKVVDGDY